MPTQVQLTRQPAIPLAVIRRRAAPSQLGTVVPQGCGTVWEFVRAHGVTAGRNVAVYLNGAIDLEVGVELIGALPEDANVVRSSTPAGLVASATHFGHYGQLGLTNSIITNWCHANGHQLAGPSWEIYGHWQAEWNDNPSRIRTDVFYLVTST